jgi:hypothetical protein
VTFDASTLAAGTYSADLCVRSNDTHRLTTTVPVTFVVADAADTIFANGFDEAP